RHYRFPRSLALTLPSTSDIYTLSLHDALPISRGCSRPFPGELSLLLITQSGLCAIREDLRAHFRMARHVCPERTQLAPGTSRNRDRKSTRLNSSHVEISYAVFCLKKKRKVVTC